MQSSKQDETIFPYHPRPNVKGFESNHLVNESISRVNAIVSDLETSQGD